MGASQYVWQLVFDETGAQYSSYRGLLGYITPAFYALQCGEHPKETARARAVEGVAVHALREQKVDELSNSGLVCRSK